jgi:hypothetical protein
VAEPDRFLDEIISRADAATFMIEGHATATIAGHDIPLGRMRTHFLEARVANLNEVRGAIAASKQDEELSVNLTLEAIGDKVLRRSLLVVRTN